MNLRNHRCDPTLLSTVAPRKAATCTHRIAQAQDKLTLISMLQVELEPTKTVASSFLTSGLNGDVSFTPPALYPPGKQFPSALYVGSSMGPRVGPDITPDLHNQNEVCIYSVSITKQLVGPLAIILNSSAA